MPEMFETLGPEWTDKGWLLEHFFDRDLKPKERAHPYIERLAHHPALHKVFSGVLGFGRTYPPELINDEIVLDVFESIALYGVDGAIEFWKKTLTRPMRGIMRAILINLSKQRRMAH